MTIELEKAIAELEDALVATKDSLVLVKLILNQEKGIPFENQNVSEKNMMKILEASNIRF